MALLLLPARLPCRAEKRTLSMRLWKMSLRYSSFICWEHASSISCVKTISRYLTVPLKLSDIKQGFETFGDFCEGTRAQLVFVSVLESAATLVFRVGDQMAGLIVDALINAGDEKMP